MRSRVFCVVFQTKTKQHKNRLLSQFFSFQTLRLVVLGLTSLCNIGRDSGVRQPAPLGALPASPLHTAPRAGSRDLRARAHAPHICEHTHKCNTVETSSLIDNSEFHELKSSVDNPK